MERNIIKEILERNEPLSMRALAKEIGYDVAVVSRVANRLQKMSHRMAYNISEAYGINLAEIIEVEGV